MAKGIYKIVCNANNVVYIGSTTVDFLKRWRKHRQRLRHNYHENSYLQNAWNKYGEDRFCFEIVEDLSESEACFIKEREAYWLSVYFPLGREFCFNMSDHTCGGNTVNSKEERLVFSDKIRKSYTPELREKRRVQAIERNSVEVARKKVNTKEWKEAHLLGVRKLSKSQAWLADNRERNKKRRIRVGTDRGEVFDSVSDAENKTGARRANIRACIRGKIKMSMGRTWHYEA